MAQVTPNSALGGCTAMEDVVAITNELYRALHRHPNKKPSDVEIGAAMQHYQDSRLERVKAIVKVGSDLTRLQACDGWYFYIMQRWITPWIGLDMLAVNIAKLCSGGNKLNFVEFQGQRGLLGWQDSMAEEAEKQTTVKASGGRASSWGGDLRRLLPLLTGALLCFTSVLWFVFPGDSEHALAGLDPAIT